MEEKQFDAKSLIGYALLFAIALWFFYTNQPTEEELEAQKQEQIAKENEENEALKKSADKAVAEFTPVAAAVDSVAQVAAFQKLGKFGFSQTLASANGGETLLENELLSLKINPT